MSDIPRDPWLTEREAAAELRVSIASVRAERIAGRIAFARVRKRVFYPLSELDAYRKRIITPAKPEDERQRGASIDDRLAMARARRMAAKETKGDRIRAGRAKAAAIRAQIARQHGEP
jgi:hypothetical protein